jgi:hypothetical protein
MQKGTVKAGETDLTRWIAIQRLGSPAGGGGGGLTGIDWFDPGSDRSGP